ncbi:hypothetical protein YC2023_107403 [Brassica napus]
MMTGRITYTIIDPIAWLPHEALATTRPRATPTARTMEIEQDLLTRSFNYFLNHHRIYFIPSFCKD